MVDWAYYFIGMGAICALLTLSVSYILSLTMRFMQDKPKTHAFKIHTISTSRCGGIGIFIAFIVVVMASFEITHTSDLTGVQADIITDVLAGIHFYIACAVLLISGLLKDTNKDTNILFVTTVQVIGTIYFIVSFGFLIKSDSVNILSIMCYFTFLLFSINSINIIDGVNGNAGFICLLNFLSLCFVACKLEANFIIFASSLMIGISGVFLCFNYPYGKIFLGDSGSFLLGFVIGALLILGIQYYDLSVFYALTLLIYPLCEVLTSIWSRFRRVTSFSVYEFLLHLYEPNNYH
ncbi:MraY family glycosyltransferase, partial [Helicobacter sp. MIT 14-3879]|uniref:MraY family glycosyltransferase n=1 Tax=Helicobacter sp. MIT 14-3879 TaxID=2040649 RepID=UPI000E36AB7A